MLELRCCNGFRRFLTGVRNEAEDILAKQINGHGEKDEILQQNSNSLRHSRESTRRCGPAIGHERNDRDGRDEREDGAQRAEDAEPLVPEAEEQKSAEQPLGHAEEPACAADAETGYIQKMGGP